MGLAYHHDTGIGTFVAEVDVGNHRAVHQPLQFFAGELGQIHRTHGQHRAGAVFRAAEDQQLVGQMAQTCQSAQQSGQRVTLRSRVLLAQRTLQFDLQPGQRRAQLVCGVADEALLGVLHR
ncbi:hypothetical protein D3C71_1583260 [compost metagenome]